MNAQSKQMLIASSIASVAIIISSIIFVSTFSLGGPTTRRFKVIMENNQYNPSAITVNLGDQVIIDFENRDSVGHAVGIPEFNATVPGEHVQPGKKATMAFLANKRTKVDAATCGGSNPTDKTDDHGEEFIVNVI